jgi:hypothetical protein
MRFRSGDRVVFTKDYGNTCKVGDRATVLPADMYLQYTTTTVTVQLEKNGQVYHPYAEMLEPACTFRVGDRVKRTGASVHNGNGLWVVQGREYEVDAIGNSARGQLQLVGLSNSRGNSGPWWDANLFELVAEELKITEKTIELATRMDLLPGDMIVESSNAKLRVKRTESVPLSEDFAPLKGWRKVEWGYKTFKDREVIARKLSSESVEWDYYVREDED